MGIGGRNLARERWRSIVISFVIGRPSHDWVAVVNVGPAFAGKASSWRSDHRADHHADNLPVLRLFIDHDGAVFGVLAARSQLDSVLARSAKALQRDLRPDPGHHDVAVGRVRGALDGDDALATGHRSGYQRTAARPKS